MKEIKDFSKIMTMKLEFETEYGKGMKKIAETSTTLIGDWYQFFLI